MGFHFDITKVVQAAGVILNASQNRKHNYTAFLKMLYIADRESILETGSPITGDTPCAMDHGPVLSLVYDLIKGNNYPTEEQRAVWSRYLCTHGNDLELVLDPGMGMLSRYEVEKLQCVYREHGHKSYLELINEVHRFPEWQEVYVPETSTRIELHTLLKALGREADYEFISRQRIEDAHLAEIFGN